MFCPNCGKEIPEGASACPTCGAALPKTAAPAPYSAAPAAKKVSAKSIVGMILGLGGLVMATLAPVYLLAGGAFGAARSYGYYGSDLDYAMRASGVVTLVFAIIGIILGIIGLILSNKGTYEGTAPANHGISKCGRVTSIITLILCGIALLGAVILMAVAD